MSSVVYATKSSGNTGHFLDLTGKVFGKRTVLWPVGRKFNSIMWLCACECGQMAIIPGCVIKRGSRSCCIHCSMKGRNTTHGMSGTTEFHMWQSAKARAKKKHLPFDLKVHDLVIPEKCPLLEIPLIPKKGSTGNTPNSPSLDRIVPSLGYVKNNIQIISMKANLMKQDATLEEMETLVHNWRRKATR